MSTTENRILCILAFIFEKAGDNKNRYNNNNNKNNNNNDDNNKKKKKNKNNNVFIFRG